MNIAQRPIYSHFTGSQKFIYLFIYLRMSLRSVGVSLFNLRNEIFHVFEEN